MMFIRLTTTVAVAVLSITAFNYANAQTNSGQLHTHQIINNGPKPLLSVTQLPVNTPLPAPVTVNFSELAAYEAAHPIEPGERFIEQEEDRDADFKFVPQKIAPGSPVTNIHLPASRAQTMSPAPTGMWNGILQTASLIPPDIRGAASSGNWVMETTNEQFNIYNKTGTLLKNVSITTFFNATGGSGYFDPHILYDANYNRFLIVIDGNVSNGDGGLFLAVSQTNDPTGSWYVYSIDDGDNSANDLLDYPLMGYNNNWVVLTANLFVGNNPTTKIYVMNRASVYSGTQGTVSTFTDASSFCVGPAQTYDQSQTTEYLVQDANGNSGGNGYMKVGTITGTATAPVYTVGTNIGVNQPWSETSVSAPQNGANTIESGDTRIGNVVYINGSLWFTHNVYLPASGPTHCGVDWWQINPASLTVQQFGRLQDATGTYSYYYPSIAVNNNGDALLGFCKSSSGTYAGAGYAFHAYTDAANTMETDTVYKPGVAYYYQTLGGGRNRWGDYTGAALDPSDNSFWGFSEWANNGSNWATVVVHVPASAPPHSPPVANFTADVTTTCLGNVQFTDLSTNVPTAWSWNFGDGTTSVLQNPAHHYTSSGTYTVTLIASNTYGSNTKTITGYIKVTEATAPSVSNLSRCGPGSFSLTANTTNSVNWYDSSGTIVSKSNPFNTPALSKTTSYWVEDTVASPSYHVGPATNGIGTGGYLSSNWGLQFSVFKASTLVSVYVYAGNAAYRTFQIANSSGTVLSQKKVYCPNGGSVVALNMDLAVGGPYVLSVSDTLNLYRNNAGAAYPYTDADSILSITGNTASGVPSYYYYFYDWVVKEHDCLSERKIVTATVSPAISTNAGTTTNPTCNGSSNGSASISATGGTPALSYLWSNGATTSNISNLSAGTYTVTITDAANCTATASKTLTAPAAINISVTSANANCGSATGSATATASGGAGNFTYLWSNGATTAAISNLAAGNYTVTGTDGNSCKATASVTINASGSLNLIPSTTDVTCNGGANGSATISVTGGTNPIHYSWSNGATTASINNVAAGAYTVTVTDGGGCSAISTRTINQPSAITASISPVNAGCGLSNGSAVANASGGTPGYTYKWSSGQTTVGISNLPAGTYTVTISDTHSCTSTASAAIINASSLTATTAAVNASCKGFSDGSALVTVLSGTQPYSYLWSNGATTSSIHNVAAGYYIVTITDGGGCNKTDTIQVGEPANGVSAVVNPTAPTCAGYTNGSATVTANGGVPGYSYQWSEGSTTSSINNLGAGSYAVTVQDGNGCTVSANFNIVSPQGMGLVSSVANDSCYGASNGTAQVVVSGGSAPYAYLWSNGSTSANLTGLAPGTYSVTITDNNHCTATASGTVSQPSQMQVFVSSTPETTGMGNGTVHVDSITGGTAPYNIIQWSNGQTTNPATNLSAGSYSVTVTDKNGCEQTATVTVSQVTGITDLTGDITFSVYPNPATSEITVELANPSKESTISLQDVLGQSLISRFSSATKTVFNTSSYASGVYFIEVKQNDKKAVKKILITH